jgi:hypothetical protein
MRLHEEIYFDITVEGLKADLIQLANFISSGELDDILEITPDLVSYSDGYAMAGPSDNAKIMIVNDEYGMELDSFDPEDFLEVFCKAAKRLEVTGCFYDVDGEEYRFVSHPGDPCFLNARDIGFNDELDEQARREELEADDNYF